MRRYPNFRSVVALECVDIVGEYRQRRIYRTQPHADVVLGTLQAPLNGRKHAALVSLVFYNVALRTNVKGPLHHVVEVVGVMHASHHGHPISKSESAHHLFEQPRSLLVPRL